MYVYVAQGHREKFWVRKDPAIVPPFYTNTPSGCRRRGTGSCFGPFLMLFFFLFFFLEPKRRSLDPLWLSRTDIINGGREVQREEDSSDPDGQRNGGVCAA